MQIIEPAVRLRLPRPVAGREVNPGDQSDLRARPIFHHQCESIEAHLIVVFAALAISRHLQQVTGISIKRLVQTLRPLQSMTGQFGAHTIIAEPTLNSATSKIIESLRG